MSTIKELTIKDLLDKIIEYNDLPKFQVERALSPILSFYIEKIISIKSDNDDIELISPEFPLKKKENNQSNNIDYLLVDKTDESIILVELKTNKRASIKDVLEHQSNYEFFINRIESERAGFLFKELELILPKSNQEEKYEYLKEKAKNINKNINKGKIIYFVPDNIRDNIREDNKKLQKNMRDTVVYGFSDLPDEIGNDSTYKEIYESLLKLNKNS